MADPATYTGQTVQPTGAPLEPNPKNRALIDDIERTLSTLEEIRRPYEPQIDDILTYVYHSRRRIKDKNTTKGGKTGIHVYDGTAQSAVNLLTDGLTGYTLSKSYNWFGYTLPQKISLAAGPSRRLDSFPDVKRWLEDCEEAMYAAFLASNLYDIAPEFVRDAATVGTVTITGDEDIENARTIFSVPHFREIYCAENQFGMVDTNYRVRKLTLKQLVEKFGYDQMVEADPAFRQAYENNRHQEREVIHARYPRVDYDPRRLDGRNKPNASVWVLRSPKRLLLESGTNQQSFVTWRWRKNNDEWYGRSPAWDAFVDAMTANQMGKSNLIGGQKMVDPPMAGPPDLRGIVQRQPGGWTSLDDMTRMPKPLNEGIQLPFSLEMQDRIDAKIREHFQVDFFLMLSQAAMSRTELTATQVIEMGGEKAAILGVRIGRMETEALSPIHDMVFAIETRAGRMPTPPQILQDFAGGDIKTEYLGPLAQAQRKLFRSQGVKQGLDTILTYGQAFPEALDLINPDESLRLLLDSFGFPQKAMNDEETVNEIRSTRQIEHEQQQQLENTLATAKAMPAAGKEIHEDSAAGMMLKEAGVT